MLRSWFMEKEANEMLWEDNRALLEWFMTNKSFIQNQVREKFIFFSELLFLFCKILLNGKK